MRLTNCSYLDILATHHAKSPVIKITGKRLNQIRTPSKAIPTNMVYPTTDSLVKITLMFQTPNLKSLIAFLVTLWHIGSRIHNLDRTATVS